MAGMTREQEIDTWLQSIANNVSWTARVNTAKHVWPERQTQIDTSCEAALRALTELAKVLGHDAPVPLYKKAEV